MADRVVVLTGSTADAMLGSIVPEPMLRDLLLVAQIPVACLDAVGATIEREPGFLSDGRLRGIVSDFVLDEQQASAALRTIRNIRPERLNQTFSTLDQWRAASPQNTERLPDGTIAALREKLPRLIRQCESLQKTRKARRLKSITGNIAQAVEILCDARPVYNSTRNAIDGLIPIVTLKIVYERQNEASDILEVMLSPDILSELLDKSTKAQQKLSVLRETIEQWLPHGLADLT
jgi:DNA-binding transcriptional regulator YbjK